MSTFFPDRNGVRARKQKRCCLCGERIDIGELKDVRKGIYDGSVWTMEMHPECHVFEKNGGVKDQDWYEDIADPAFDRSDALAFKPEASK